VDEPQQAPQPSPCRALRESGNHGKLAYFPDQAFAIASQGHIVEASPYPPGVGLTRRSDSGTWYCRRIYNVLPLGFVFMHASSFGKAALVSAVFVALVHEFRVDSDGIHGCPGFRTEGTRVQSDTVTKVPRPYRRTW